MDPETGYDAVASLDTNRQRITVFTQQAITGKDVIKALLWHPGLSTHTFATLECSDINWPLEIALP
ncbi:MAG: hypothetical protein ACI9WS_001749 [Paraglaciecola psychrophila]|jgi:hypothetical protein